LDDDTGATGGRRQLPREHGLSRKAFEQRETQLGHGGVHAWDRYGRYDALEGVQGSGKRVAAVVGEDLAVERSLTVGDALEVVPQHASVAAGVTTHGHAEARQVGV